LDAGYIYGTKKPNFSTSYTPKKKLKLPDPPSKSILKNKLSPQQQEANNKTIQYHGDLETLINYTDDNLELTTGKPRERRKSYAGMSDEELMALDPQFLSTKSRTGSIDKFKFDSQKTYYLSAPKKVSASVPKPTTTYPSSNENNYKAISMTVKHRDYDKFEFNRTLVTVISGRRHSWNSLDWLFLINKEIDESLTFIQDGDFLVVSSLIPTKLIAKFGHKHQTMDEYLYKKCERLSNYILNSEILRESKLKIKLTVEFILDNDDPAGAKGYKYMINHVFNQYQPNLFVIGTKSSNFNFKYPVQVKTSNREEYLIKLSSYIIKYSPVPVILVGHSTKYHNFGEVEKKRKNSALKFEDEMHSPYRGRRRPSHTSYMSSESLSSIELYNGKQDNESVLTSESCLSDKVMEILESEHDCQRFVNAMKLISDNSLTNSNAYMKAISSKGDNMKIDPKIHSIYRNQTRRSLTSMGGSLLRSSSGSSDTVSSSVYKVKSLLGDEDLKPIKEKLVVSSIPNTPSIIKQRTKSASSTNGNSSIAKELKASHSSEDKSSKGKTSIWKKFSFKK
jgi:hypothetical protein